MYQELALEPGEMIVRVFFRGEGQSNSPHAIDFERRLKIQESGLSFCRQKLMSLRKLIDVTRNRDKELNRGLAVARASSFLDLGYRFLGHPEKPGHVCLHCSRCNNIKTACKCEGACPLDATSTESDDVRDELASLMTVLVEASSVEEILSVFGSDVPESDVAAANTIYMARWNEHKTSPVRTESR